ncbi:hypothetical protein [Pseudomonas syringae]
MDIGAIGKMLGMARGQESLEQGGAQGKQGAEEKDKLDPMKMLMEMLSKAAGGALGGGGGSQGSGGSGGSEGQMDPEMLQKLMAGRQGMEAMMPDDDTGRKVGG